MPCGMPCPVGRRAGFTHAMMFSMLEKWPCSPAATCCEAAQRRHALHCCVCAQALAEAVSRWTELDAEQQRRICASLITRIGDICADEDSFRADVALLPALNTLLVEARACPL